jgi:hypothetical protein
VVATSAMAAITLVLPVPGGPIKVEVSINKYQNGCNIEYLESLRFWMQMRCTTS